MASSSTLPDCRYRALALGEIRILELLPGTRSAPIVCRLRHTLIENFSDCEAVSYTWGTDPNDDFVEVDGGRLEVTPNLEAALMEFRNVDTTRQLWIDAICINQSDLEERSKQVQLMGQIYSRSKGLLVWLGVENDGSNLAMAFVALRGIRMKGSPDQRRRWLIEEQAILPSITPIFEALGSLLSRPWFTRTWIVQEYVLAANGNAIFHCGTKLVSSDDLGNKELREFDEILPPLATSGPGSPDYECRRKLMLGMSAWDILQNAENTRLLHSIYETADAKHKTFPARTNTSTIVYWLEAARGTKATDPRDKVYAILGIVDHVNQGSSQQAYDRRSLIVDYTATVQDVYASVVKATVIATGKLDILGSCSLGRTLLVDRSWVPDWTSRGRVSFIRGTPGIMTGNPTCFSASGDSAWIGHFAENLATFTITDFVWDIIDIFLVVTDDVDETEKEDPSFLSEIYKQDCVELWDFLKRTPVYGTENDAKMVFWRSMISSPWNCRKKTDKPGGNIVDPPHMVSPLTSPDPAASQAAFLAWPDDMRSSCWSNTDLIETINHSYIYGRDFFLTKNGFMGQTSYSGKIKEGDAYSLAVLRRLSSDQLKAIISLLETAILMELCMVKPWNKRKKGRFRFRFRSLNSIKCLSRCPWVTER